MGLALSDELQMTARPLAIWLRTNRRRDLARLRQLCKQHGVSCVVVGWPLHLDGRESPMAEEARQFAERIRKDLRLPVELADERLSSWEAEQTVAETSSRRRTSPRGQRKSLDDVSAAVILRDYLSRAAARE